MLQRNICRNRQTDREMNFLDMISSQKIVLCWKVWLISVTSLNHDKWGQTVKWTNRRNLATIFIIQYPDISLKISGNISTPLSKYFHRYFQRKSGDGCDYNITLLAPSLLDKYILLDGGKNPSAGCNQLKRLWQLWVVLF